MQERLRKRLIMPDLVGLRERDARIMLRNQGFRDAIIHFVESYEELDTVVQHAPMKGQLIDSETPITLNVAKRSYVNYLPQIYKQEAATGTSFLKNYLWIFQHQVESVTSRLDGAHRYFDPYETPETFLPWLATWVALAIDVDWPDIKKRKLVKRAAQMYGYRGTRRALKEILGIFVGQEPRIEENAWPYRGFRVGVTSTIAEDTIILPTIKMDHCFIVHIPIAADEITEETVVKIHNIITMEKPAHTTYFLQFKTEDKKATPQVYMTIGVAATIGMTPLEDEGGDGDSTE